jgi:hypothetical protein
VKISLDLKKTPLDASVAKPCLVAYFSNRCKSSLRLRSFTISGSIAPSCVCIIRTPVYNVLDAIICAIVRFAILDADSLDHSLVSHAIRLCSTLDDERPLLPFLSQ